MCTRLHPVVITEAEHSLSLPLPDGGEDGLKAMILARHKSREQQASGFLDSLEARYAKKPRAAKSEGEGPSSSKAGKSTQRKGTKKKGRR